MITRNQSLYAGIANRPSMWVGLILVVALAGTGYNMMNSQMADSNPLNQPLFAVREGPLTISIGVSGTIQAREKVIITSELEGQSTILYLVPEGQKVKKGDLLIELDSSSLQDNLVDQSISVQNAEASYINARENLAIVESQSKSDIDQAQLVFDFAKLDLRKYKEGEYPKLKDERLSEIKLKEEELSQAEETLRWSEILYKEKYLSQTVYQKDELAANRTGIQLDLAKADLQLLQDYEYKRQLEQLTSDVKQAEMALDRTKRQANASIVQASAELQAKQSEYERQQSKMEKLKDQIKKAKIYAPQDGLVVYATSVRQGRRFGSEEPLDEGQTVRERQELIHLPTTSSYIAEVKIPESSLEKIHVDLPVVITIDAVPGKKFYGRVMTIAPLPDAQSSFMNPDLKVYDSQILISGNGDDLRSGMSCQSEIIIDQFEKATYIPVQAVLPISGTPTVFVLEDGVIKPREVELGPDNNIYAQIASGLSVGEKVLLTPPLAAAQVDEHSKTQLVDIPEMESVANQGGRNRQPGAGEGEGGRGFGAPQGGMGGGQGVRGQGQGRGDRQARGGGGGGFGGPQGGGGFGGPQGVGGEGQRGGGRGGFGNMTPEQREEMRKRFENMSDEERAAMRQRFMQNRQGGDESGGRGGQGQDQGGPGGGERRPNRNGGGNE